MSVTSTVRPARTLRRSLASTLLVAALLGGGGGVVLDTATATTASAATIDSLTAGGTLAPGDVLRSPNGGTYLTMQSDGNAVVYRTTGPSTREVVWHTGTANQPGAYMVNQGDGNLVIYKPLSNGDRAAVWQSGTGGRGAARLIVQDDQNLVLYANSNGAATWSWKTGIINAAPTGTSSLRQNIVNTALGEVGKPRAAEGAGNCNYYSSQVSSSGGSCTTPSGATGRKEAWCAQFVRWTLQTAGAGNVNKMNAGAVSVRNYGTWRSTSGNATGVQPGDLIGFRLTSGGTSDDHVGIVVAVSGTTVTSVEGNAGDTVSRVTRPLTSSAISGYATPVAR